MMIVVGLAAGLVVGLVIGLLGGRGGLKKQVTALEENLATSQKSLEAAKKELSSAQEQKRSGVAQIEEKLAAATGEMNKLKHAAEQARKELAEAQTSLNEVDQARNRAVEVSEGHRMARQQAEGRIRQVETMLTEAQQQIREMGTELETLKSERASLSGTIERQSKELQRLRADAASDKSSKSGLDESVEAFASTDGSLEGILKVLIKQEGQSSAVVADSNGIVVAAAGDNELRDGIAATTQMVRTVIRQLEGMVPFADLRAYALHDLKSNVIAGRFFSCSGESVGLATYGSRQPSDRLLDGAMANLRTILE